MLEGGPNGDGLDTGGGPELFDEGEEAPNGLAFEVGGAAPKGPAPKGEGFAAAGLETGGGGPPNGEGLEVGGAAAGEEVGGGPLKGDGPELGGPNGPELGVEVAGGANGEGLDDGGPKGPGAVDDGGGGPGFGGPACLSKKLLGGAAPNRFEAGEGAFGGWLS